MPIVHIRISDDAGQPTPCRVHITDPENRIYAPLGMPVIFPTGVHESPGPYCRIAKENWYAVGGSFEIELPSQTPLRVRVLKGPCVTPLDETVTLNPGQLTARFTLKRWSNSTATAVDTRCHFDSPHDLLRQALAEDVHVANLLVREHPAFSHDGHLYPIAEHLSAFSGQSSALELDGSRVVVNTFNVHPSLGRLGLLHTHRPTFPLSFGETSDDWNLGAWCDQAHRKRGLTVWADAFHPTAGLLGGDALISALLGQIDAFEIDPSSRTQPILPWYYRLLNAGVMLPLVAGSARMANTVPVGAMRTYAEGDWVDAVRTGRTFMTNGPMLEMKTSDSITASAESITPFDHLQIVHNGHVIATSRGQQNDAGRWSASIQINDSLPESGWIAARVMGTQPSLLYSPMPVFAHTSPVAVDVPGRPFSNRRASLPLLRQCVEGVQRWADDSARFGQDKFKKQLLDRCARALLTLAE